jgi:hypothetical protein
VSSQFTVADNYPFTTWTPEHINEKTVLHNRSPGLAIVAFLLARWTGAEGFVTTPSAITLKEGKGPNVVDCLSEPLAELQAVFINFQAVARCRKILLFFGIGLRGFQRSYL